MVKILNEQKHADQKRRFVAHARKLFASHGVMETSMSQIARACKVTKAGLYHYFKSKDEILKEIFLSHVEEKDHVANVFKLGKDLEETLYLLGKNHLLDMTHAEHVELMKILLSETMKNPEMRKFYDSFIMEQIGIAVRDVIIPKVSRTKIREGDQAPPLPIFRQPHALFLAPDDGGGHHALDRRWRDLRADAGQDLRDEIQRGMIAVNMNKTRWNMKKLIPFLIVISLAAGRVLAQQKLPLEDYLQQVQRQGTNYKAAKAQAEGYEKESHQQDLTYSPQLVAGYNHLDDSSQQVLSFYGTRTQMDSAGVSLTDMLPFGPSVSVGYSFEDSNYSGQSLAGAFAQLFPTMGITSITQEYQISPVISVSVPLFKNFGGVQTNAGVKAVQYGLESAEKLSTFQMEGVLFNAKVAYWNLALAREQVDIRKDTLNRNQKIWDWTKRRVARNLADPPDALQAEASVRQAELDLQTALNGERSARLAFNRYRNGATEEVPEELEALEDSLSGVKVDIPSKLPERTDLQAVEAQARQMKATYDETYQNIYPDITAIASWRGNGLDPNFQNANNIAFGTDHPTWMLGAQFNLSLDLFTAERTAEGYKRQYESSILGLQDKQLEVDQDWRDLQDRLADVEKRLAMAADIESLQQQNADAEKNQLALGRTTQFQLLSIENQYSMARLSRLSLVAEKLGLLAQAQWWLSAE